VPSKARLIGLVPYGLALVVLLGLPTVIDPFNTFEMGEVILIAIGVMGVNVVTGYSGQITLGNGAFMAIGGYTSAILAQRYHVPYLETIPVAALVAAVAGFLFGIPALRLSGLYLALATFGLAVAMPSVIKYFEGVTNGTRGILLHTVHAPPGIDQQLSDSQYFYYLVLVIAGILFVLAWNFLNSRTGRALTAIRDNETAAASSGVNVNLYKTLAFGVSALFAGVSGSLLVMATAYVNPESFDFPLSLGLLVGAVVGGLGSRWGPLLGALVVVYLPLLSERYFHARPDILYGLLLILIMFLMPTGIVGGVYRLWAYYQERRARARKRPDSQSPEPGLASP
jgi:branched-chain amino acid transport system permease protein